MALQKLQKTLTVLIRLDSQGTYQAEFIHALEGFELGSYIEAGHSRLHSGSEITQMVMAGLEKWFQHPWALEMQKRPQS